MIYCAGPARTDNRSYTTRPKRKAEQEENENHCMAFLRGKGYKNQKMCVQLYCKVLGDKINFEIGLYKLYQRSID